MGGDWYMKRYYNVVLTVYENDNNISYYNSELFFKRTRGSSLGDINDPYLTIYRCYPSSYQNHGTMYDSYCMIINNAIPKLELILYSAKIDLSVSKFYIKVI